VNGLVAVLGAMLTGQTQLINEAYKSFHDFSDCFQTNK
jgi:hypothetical protein